MKSNNETIPEMHTMTEMLRGQASKIFDDVCEKNQVVIVNRNSKPCGVIISYDRYKKLKNEGVDI